MEEQKWVKSKDGSEIKMGQNTIATDWQAIAHNRGREKRDHENAFKPYNTTPSPLICDCPAQIGWNKAAITQLIGNDSVLCDTG
jgi:hypothetical protein